MHFIGPPHYKILVPSLIISANLTHGSDVFKAWFWSGHLFKVTYLKLEQGATSLFIGRSNDLKHCSGISVMTLNLFACHITFVKDLWYAVLAYCFLVSMTSVCEKDHITKMMIKTPSANKQLKFSFKNLYFLTAQDKRNSHWVCYCSAYNYLFKVNNENTRKTWMTLFWCFYCQLWTD